MVTSHIQKEIGFTIITSGQKSGKRIGKKINYFDLCTFIEAVRTVTTPTITVTVGTRRRIAPVVNMHVSVATIKSLVKPRLTSEKQTRLNTS